MRDRESVPASAIFTSLDTGVERSVMVVRVGVVWEMIVMARAVAFGVEPMPTDCPGVTACVTAIESGGAEAFGAEALRSGDCRIIKVALTPTTSSTAAAAEERTTLR